MQSIYPLRELILLRKEAPSSSLFHTFRRRSARHKMRLYYSVVYLASQERLTVQNVFQEEDLMQQVYFRPAMLLALSEAEFRYDNGLASFAAAHSARHSVTPRGPPSR